MMKPEQLAAIAAREKAATKGPWVFDSSYSICDAKNRTMLKIPDDADEQYYLLNCFADCPEWYRESEANAKFSAHSRADIPDLLNEVVHLAAENAELKVQLQMLIDIHAVHTQMILDQDDTRIAELEAKNVELRKDAARVKGQV